MNMNEQVGKWSFEHPGQIVGMCEAHEDRGENDDSHAGEKKIVRAPAAMVANDFGCHKPSYTDRIHDRVLART